MAAAVTPERRKAVEVAHGQALVNRAAVVWGQNGRAGQERVERRSDLLLDAVDAAPATQVLELGCGTGEYTARFATRPLHLVALDLSDHLLRLAHRRVRDRRMSHGATLFLRGDAERLPFPDARFDAVIGNAVLHHLAVPEALSEVYRVLRPGGRCAFTEPNMLNPQVAVQKNLPPVKRWLGDTPHETAFLAPIMRRWLRGAGFTVETVRPFDFLHPALPSAAVPVARRLERVLEALPLVRHLSGSLLIVARRPLAAGVAPVEGRHAPV